MHLGIGEVSQLQGDIIHHYVLHPTIIWDVTSYCNFKCTYCYSDHMPNRLLRMTDKYSLDDIAEAFAEYCPDWAIVYIGGEPFIFRDFADLNVKLTRTNKIGIYSNLSIGDHVRRFADHVPPDRVTFINCGLHIAERLKHDADFEKFLELYQLLKGRGYPAVITYIMHPSVASRAAEDLKHFADLDAKIYLKVFRGIHNGRSFPESYEPAVLDLIEMPEPATIRGDAVRAQMTGEGCMCRAGMILLDMDVDGNVYRCLTDRSLRRDCMGNLFRGTLRLEKSPSICCNSVCLSARQGMGFSLSGFRSLSTTAI
jgi:MoaA/NifB/PqqE/SkfB family radical SAM enzyme